MSLVVFPKGHKYYGYAVNLAAVPARNGVISYKRNSAGERMSGNANGYFKINGVSVHISALWKEALDHRQQAAAHARTEQQSKTALTVDAVAVSVKDKSSQFFSKGTSVNEVEAQLVKRGMLTKDDLVLLDVATGAKIPFAVTRVVKLG